MEIVAIAVGVAVVAAADVAVVAVVSRETVGGRGEGDSGGDDGAVVGSVRCC